MFLRIKANHKGGWWFNSPNCHNKVIEVGEKVVRGLHDKACYDVLQNSFNLCQFSDSFLGTLIYVSATKPIAANNREASKYYLKQ